ncbi:class I SAM-dependent methyltransferase [Salinirubellus salinus]|uniref:Class I SAM-dependent methyltransferase n=1 Tax=Salinirubellus salinus TaxID=1364945 RepID=A0A9E7UB97_9EURY|nr:class I SAM-dependent methyltransferase [Salinirubellus salinus]UWM54857.1 class I SAM-dependent methyltransferase [Salinirubellus salinus]
MPDDPPAEATDGSHEAHEVYDETASAYAAGNPSADARAAYEWPAVREVLPDVDGRRVLDAGTGTGHYAAWLAERGADVVGLDASAGMLREAHERTDGPAFVHGDLRAPLPFPDATFDLVCSQLTLDHVEDWDAPFAEFARVCRPGGTLVVSVDHPFTTYFVVEEEPEAVGNATAQSADYYAVERFEKVWPHVEGEGETRMPVYRRPLAEVTRPLFAAGFAVTDLREPEPESDAEHLRYFAERTPRFLVVCAEKE